MNIFVSVNNTSYEQSDPLCMILTYEGKYAFIQAVETTYEGEKKIRRYWGKWNGNIPIKSIEMILRQANPWPDLPPMPKTNQIATGEEHNAEAIPTLVDAYEALDRELYSSGKTLEPSKKREAAEALYKAYLMGEIKSLDLPLSELQIQKK